MVTKKFVARQVGGRDGGRDGGADFGLVLVLRRGIDVTIPQRKSTFDSRLAGRSRHYEGTESPLGNRDALYRPLDFLKQQQSTFRVLQPC